MKKLYSSLAATSVMTLFSYGLTFLSGSNLKEPQILAQLTSRIPLEGRRKNIRTGWLLHYAVGLLFTEMYIQFWKNSSPNSEKRTGLIYGGMAGLAAILIWKFTLSVHPFPPSLNFGLFSLNLFFGHVIFGIISAMTYP